MGLVLVRELVKRELGGAFILQPQEGGGTVATVVIPAHKQGAES
jgi:sensor histidine kinase regulating citrate/malate metabolism